MTTITTATDTETAWLMSLGLESIDPAAGWLQAGNVRVRLADGRVAIYVWHKTAPWSARLESPPRGLVLAVLAQAGIGTAAARLNGAGGGERER